MNLQPSTAAEWLCYFLHPRTADIENAYITFGDTASPVGIADIAGPDLLHLAQRHSVAPLLYFRLKTDGLQDSVPEQMFQTLQQAYLYNAARNMRLYHKLAQILTLLNERNIPVIVLKGAYLAEAVYENIALRTMADIDLLVKESDLQKAVEILYELGYAPDTTWATTAHLPPFTKPGKIRVELHWTLEDPASPFTIDTDGLWERASESVVANVTVYGLSPEDLLLHICLHLAFRHYFTIGLKALYDIGEILQDDRHELDWNIVESRAGQWRVERCVYLSLHYTNDLLSLDMPIRWLEAFRIPPPAPKFIQGIGKSILKDESLVPQVNPNLVQLRKITH
ncbi:MAG: nucleotidyltransferase family protein, partial [bacterium]|nr:nucleotidyltransferase family protein [bacterium]